MSKRTATMAAKDLPVLSARIQCGPSREELVCLRLIALILLVAMRSFLWRCAGRGAQS